MKFPCLAKISLLTVAASLASTTSLLAQSSTDYSNSASLNASAAAGGGIGGIIGLVIGVVVLIGMWKVFAKAGQPGWACIVPFYNIYVLCKIVGRPGWWLLLFLVPFVNLIIAILLYVGLAKSFGKGAGYGVGLVFLPFIFFPILGFGDATYQGPSA
jgi:hypothetical protein